LRGESSDERHERLEPVVAFDWNKNALELLRCAVIRRQQSTGAVRHFPAVFVLRNQVVRDPFLVGDIQTTAGIDLRGESSDERHERHPPNV
jgi:hypothetical protein